MRTDDRIMVDMAKALARMIYETTHLSPEQDDGSHWCKISAEALNEARAALAALPKRLVPAAMKDGDAACLDAQREHDAGRRA